jgi:septum site-determining protein MinD
VILAVIGGKGGVGKSTVALSVAAEFDAVCVDGDLGMADLPERRGPDLHDVLAGRATAVEAVDESGPVPLLPCGRTLAGARATEPTALRGALASVADEYGRVVVDCPAGLGRDSGAALAAADACLVVTARDRAAMADALRTRELARTLDAGLVAVVVNFAAEPGNARRRFGAPAVALPESRTVEAATRNGLPIGAVAPDGRAVERIREVARLVQRSTSST